MKNSILVIALFWIILEMVNGSMVQGNQNVVGEWKYEAPTAPYGYQKGVITLTVDKSVLSGEVKFDSGYKIQLKDAIFEGDTLKLGLYVDYEYVTLTTKVTGNKMKGTADSSKGEMAFNAEKIIKAEKK
jgi:hypothetical protein